MTSPRQTPPQGAGLCPLFGDPIGPWHRAFVWLPVWTHDRGWVWLRRVWRRQIQKYQHLDGGADFWWQHSVGRVS